MVQRLLPWLWTGLIGFLAILLGVTGLGTTVSQLDAALGLVVLVPLMAITALGSIMSVRQPGNRIAWLLHVVSLVLLLTLWSFQIVDARQPESPGFLDYFAVVVQNAVAPVMLYAVFLLLFLFPTGTFMTPLWKWAWWLGLTYFSALLFVATFVVEIGADFVDEPWSMANPIGFLPNEALTFMNGLMPFLLLAVAIGGVVSITARYRRSDLVVRTQIKWVLLAAVVSLVALPMGISDIEVLSDLFMMTTIIAIPTAVTLAITRYKLFEIDRIISRTISYAIVVVLLAGVYFGMVVGVGSFLPSNDPLLVAGATLAVAALFNPLRRRIQHAVDGRFNRSRYQAEIVSAEFAATLREPMTSDEIVDLWSQTVERSVQPQAAGIWLKKT